MREALKSVIAALREILLATAVMVVILIVFSFFYLRANDRRLERERGIDATKVDTTLDEYSYISALPIRDAMRESVPDWKPMWLDSGMGYEFKNETSNKLIVTLGDGPGWFDDRIDWRRQRVAGYYVYDLFLHLLDEYSIFVPEKFDWGRGKQPAPFEDAKERERYTVDNLITNYAEVIEEYLSQNDYGTIIIAGFSEGGFIAPELYFRLKDFDISGLVSIAAGGLSPYESQEILFERYTARESPFLPAAIGEEGMLNAFQFGSLYAGVLEPYRSEPYPNPQEPFGELGSLYYPTTHLWLRSFLFRRPFEYYRDINIPVLFQHGEFDFRVSIESTRYVEENLPEKPFTYNYYPEMWHGPRKYGEFMAMRRDIAAWLKAEGL